MLRCGWSVVSAFNSSEMGGPLIYGAWAWGHLPSKIQATPIAELYALCFSSVLVWSRDDRCRVAQGVERAYSITLFGLSGVLSQIALSLLLLVRLYWIGLGRNVYPAGLEQISGHVRTPSRKGSTSLEAATALPLIFT